MGVRLTGSPFFWFEKPKCIGIRPPEIQNAGSMSLVDEKTATKKQGRQCALVLFRLIVEDYCGRFSADLSADRRSSSPQAASVVGPS